MGTCDDMSHKGSPLCTTKRNCHIWLHFHEGDFGTTPNLSHHAGGVTAEHHHGGGGGGGWSSSPQKGGGGRGRGGGIGGDGSDWLALGTETEESDPHGIRRGLLLMLALNEATVAAGSASAAFEGLQARPSARRRWFRSHSSSNASTASDRRVGFVRSTVPDRRAVLSLHGDQAH